MRSDRVHVLLGLLEGDAWFKTAHDEEPVEVVVDLFRLEDQGDNELRLSWRSKMPGRCTPTTV